MKTDLLLLPKLNKGDLVRLVSPASYPDQSAINEYISALEGWGLRCDTGEHVLSKFGYMAGTDAERLTDLNEAFRDPQVRAIITTRGGAGAYRIADDIDFKAARADPKPLVGFSDITSLHLSLFKQCRLGGIHGCLYGTTAQLSVKQLLMSTKPYNTRTQVRSCFGESQIPRHCAGTTHWWESSDGRYVDWCENA